MIKKNNRQCRIVLQKLEGILDKNYAGKRIIILNEEQKASIEQGIKDYEEGRFYTTDELFDELGML